MEFSELQLHQELRRGIADAGYTACMPVQEQVLAHAFGGQDLYVQSQTGTGKTAAFLIVIFQRLLSEPLLGGKKALIMVPTRELAVQVEEEAKVLGRYLPFKIGSFYGGVGYAQQQRLLKDNVQVLVGTPGRVLDLNKSGQMNLMDLAFLIIDEADRMFDMGFYPDLRNLIKVVPPADRRQTMLFSATLNSRVKNLAWEYTKNPFEIEIEPETVTVDEVEQLLYHVHSGDKMRLLLGILQQEQPESVIIFCNTKRYAEIVAKRLRVNGFECEFIIGDLPQVKRLKIIEDLKSGIVKALVATDVAARGLDIEGLALVVNYDLPVEAENYVHRIGRTARAGKTGKAVTLASEQDVYELPDIERYIGKKIPSQLAEGDLLAEDKSEGLRIRTDFYDDRGRRDGPGRRGGSGMGRGSGTGRGSGAGRGTGTERGDGRRSGAGRGEGPGRRDGTGRGGRRDERGGNRDYRNGPEQRGGSGTEYRRRETPEEQARGEERAGRTRSGEEKTPEKRRSGISRTGNSRPGGRQENRNLSSLSLEERMAYYKEKYEKREGSSGSGGQRRGQGPRQTAPEPGGFSPSAGKGAEKTGPAAGGDTAKSPPEKPGVIGKLLGIFGKKKGP